MKLSRRKKLALSLVVVLTTTVQILACYNFGTVQWVPDCGRLCFVSRVYTRISGTPYGTPYTVEFAGVNFTFLYIDDSTTIQDLGTYAYFDIEFSGWTAHDISIYLGGGWVRPSLFGPLESSTVEHDGRVVGVATAHTYLMEGHWVFLVSV